MEHTSPDEAPNAMTEARFRELMRRGYQAEVACTADSRRSNGKWHGEWIVRVVDKDKAVEKVLMKMPRHASSGQDLEPRRFKTIDGLHSFMTAVGFIHVHIPAYEGSRSVQALPSDVIETDND